MGNDNDDLIDDFGDEDEIEETLEEEAEREYWENHDSLDSEYDRPDPEEEQRREEYRREHGGGFMRACKSNCVTAHE
ncbi:hypothetical protein VAWG004_03250 [Aeromonas veronii]|uniref:hypothetical protein n=1 Tax=Aeromonas veronii TaxID=654 RepID=UPI002B28CE5F|nr:hypothetical protein VAWG004_03250 [Aeromonas veronii]